ncbi:MBL fold metallo-hydrolase [Novosphingobium aerophilum]|uniref:MBL fold metallo-hydrolase n=1 Tax=Novosphingobium TaxID=165696 RepID=UPI0010ED542F|nr:MULTISPECIES: 3',5'-cyclic-nucleotide phosphodiesterase [unclassified Novosphingobium]TCM41452.1 3',5'-cyclic-nucleotide phosphodiesterase [Novosphingobium sp. ST904]WRT95399.1 3',5'-cyclic-nucleotide phosphodiesterase [Novosphingobium sp. RL4]
MFTKTVITLCRFGITLLGAVAAMSGPVSAAPAKAAFDLVPLGVEGGVVEGATTAWFIAASGSRKGLACDAGTLVPGIRAAIAKGGFPAGSRASDVLHEGIGAYLITHPHLDHVAGLVMASPDDSAKPILALPEVNAALSAHYFNWSSWPNMGDRGQPPMLRRYRYEDLVAGGKPVPVGDTGLSVTAYPLSHGGSLSTAFLIRSGEDALLCMGDTGPDAVEHSARLEALWQAIAPLVRAGRLRAIIVETSYPDPRKDTELYGHLTPKWLRAELGRLAAAAGGADRLKGLPVVIGHIKPSIDGAEPAVSAIMRQLAEGGSPPVRYILAEQGKALEL